MAQRGRIGGYTTRARHDGPAITASARRAFLARFERQVDPDGLLDPAERSRRAESAKRAYMLQLAMRRRRRRS